MSTRRQRLAAVAQTATSNAGLWLDKYISEQAKEDTESRRNLVSQVASLPEPPEYAGYFERWHTALAAMGATMREADVQGRCLIGLGEESVIETSITLQHTYGLPHLPGSALKGLAARYAREKLDPVRWGVGSPAYQVLFGTTSDAGYVTFFDALYVPGSGHGGRALQQDVLTVHHKDYYEGGALPPADWDSPNPVPFLSASGRYLVALAGPPRWVAAALDILALALQESGVGAKTSTGYGRMTLKPVEVPDRAASFVPAGTPVRREHGQVAAEALLRRLDALKHDRVASEIPQFVDAWRALEASKALRRQVAERIVARVRSAGREKASADKAWYQELLAYLESQSRD